MISPSVHANNFDEPAHPIAWEVYPTGFSARFDLLFDHLFPEDPELGLGGRGRVYRYPADLFRNLSFILGNHILPLRGISYIALGSHPPEFKVRTSIRSYDGEWFVGKTESAYGFPDDPDRFCYQAIKWLHSSYKIVMKLPGICQEKTHRSIDAAFNDRRHTL